LIAVHLSLDIGTFVQYINMLNLAKCRLRENRLSIESPG